jgi:hypothetical protein
MADSSAWWARKMEAMRAANPALPPAPPAASGNRAWWKQSAYQREETPPQPMGVPGNQPQQETCPRCGGSNYAAVNLDTSMGGRFMVGDTKRCFDCRYPMFNASGDLVHSGGGVRYGSQTAAQKLNVRQVDGGRGEWNGFDAAPNIDHLL